MQYSDLIDETQRNGATKAVLALNCEEEFGYRGRGNNLIKDRMPQELSYLWKFHLDEAVENGDKDTVVMLCSDTIASKESAGIIYRVIAENPWSQWFEQNSGTPYEVAENVDAEKGYEFKQSGINNWMNKIREIVRRLETQGFKKIYLNITGGYKGTVPYSTLAGMLYPKNVCITYLFEDSKEIITIPTYPVGLDFRQWHENALRLRMMEIETSRKYFVPDLPLRNLLMPTGLSDFGEALREQYQAQLSDDPIKVYSKDIVSRLLSSDGPYVGGSKPEGAEPDNGLIWDRDAAGKLRSILNNLIDRSGDIIWLGDKIPEMVDHAQRHHHDLLEFTELFLSPIFFHDLGFMNVYERFVLLSGVLLHDSGHALDMLSKKDCQDLKGIFGTINELKMPDEIPLLPCDVRDYHQYLSGIRLNNSDMAKELGWPGTDGFTKEGLPGCLHEAVIITCLYHRRRMDYDAVLSDTKGILHLTGQRPIPLKDQGLAGGEGGCEIDLLKVVAFLRIIDGCDSQARRAGPPRRVHLFLSILQRDYQTAAIRCRSAYDAFKEGPDHPKKRCWGLALLEEKTGGRGYVTEPFSIEDGERKIRKQCLEMISCGHISSNLKQSARLWLMAAESANRAQLRFGQWSHFLKHQAVAEMRIVPDDGFSKNRFKFHVILVPENSEDRYRDPQNGQASMNLRDWLNKIVSPGSSLTLKKEIEKEVSSEFDAVQEQAMNYNLELAYWWEDAWAKRQGISNPGKPFFGDP